MTGGFAGLTGAYICGARLGRFSDPRNPEKKDKKDLKVEIQGSQVADESTILATSNNYEDVHNKYMAQEIEIEEVHGWIRAYQSRLEDRNFGSHSAQSVVLGTLILWVGWMFFNGGSSLGISGSTWEDASLAMVNTILAPCAAGLFTLLTRKHITGENKDVRLDFGAVTNGLLAGCVSITAGCAAVDQWAAVVIGIIGSIMYSLGCRLLNKLEIDDPLEAF
jgi:ammonia channel protein AmtB